MCTTYTESQKNAQHGNVPYVHCKVSAISGFCPPTTQTPSITNCLVAIILTKPVIAILVPKWVLGCHDNVPQHLWTPYSTIPMPHPSPQPKLYRFSHYCRAHRRVSLYFTMGRPFPPQNCPFPWGDLEPHLIRGSLGPHESTTQTASLLVQPFFAGLTSVTDKPADKPRYSVGNNRPRLHTVLSTAMQPNNGQLPIVCQRVFMYVGVMYKCQQ